MSLFWGPFTKQPNILILITDQQRTTQHYPSNWVEKNLPNLTALQQSGVTFSNGMTNTTACSPSRGTLFTSTYPTLNGVTEVGDTLNMGELIHLPDGKDLPLVTLDQLMQDADLVPAGINYEVSYKGKFHLDSSYASKIAPDKQKAHQIELAENNQSIAETYGLPGWTSPDFGDSMVPAPLPEGSKAFYSLGAGLGENDARVTDGVSYPHSVINSTDYLKNYVPNSDGTNPFCLVVSLLNPHDVWVSPDNYENAGFLKEPDGLYPWQKGVFLEINLPQSYDLSSEQLANKPTIQNNWTRPGYTNEQAIDYIRFYAYLETLSDELLGKVVTSLNNNPNELTKDTLIIRLADHGEMGMAQAGMIEKEHQAYNETLLVPMIFSNPGLPQGLNCEGLAGLIDIMPTIAEITGQNMSNLYSKYAIQGQSIADAILSSGEIASTYDQFLFATDDSNAHIRCLVDTDKKCKYAVYYHVRVNDSNPNGTAFDFQYEMYNFSSNPETRDDEATNLVPLDGDSSGEIAVDTQILWHNMHQALTTQLQTYGQEPEGWPKAPELPSQ